MRNLERDLEKMKYKISNLENALWARENIMAPLESNDPFKILYEGKFKQLQELVESLGSVRDNYLAYIEPKSFYSRTYVLRFTRDSLSIKTYNISFDSKYSVEDSPLEYRANASTTIQISPNPFALNILTILFSLLGTVLKISINPGPNIEIRRYFPYFYELDYAILSQGVTSVIVGILFFNIFEYTDYGKNLKMGVTWRTALVIGILSGLFSEKLIEAIKVFIGIP